MTTGRVASARPTPHVGGVVVVVVTGEERPRSLALEFVDGIVDAAPTRLERAADNVQALENLLTWGAPQQAPLQYKGSAVDNFLASRVLWGGNPVSLGPLGDVTNSVVAVVALGTGMAGAYSASYAYYVALQEEADRAAAEKKDKAAATKRAKAEVEAKKKEKKVKTAATEAEKAKADAPAAPPKAEVAVPAAAPEKSAATETRDGTEDETPESNGTTGRKREAFKSLFRRGGKR